MKESYKVLVSIDANEFIKTKRTLYETLIFLYNRKSLKKNLEYIIKVFKKYNIGGLELVIPYRANTNYIRKIRKEISKFNIKVCSVHQPLSNKFNISIEEISALCSYASILEAKLVVIHSEAIRDYIQDLHYIKQLEKISNRYSVAITIENMGYTRAWTKKNKILADPEIIRNTILDSSLQLTYDTTHIAHSGFNLINKYKNCYNKIINIHISDYKRTIPSRVIPKLGTHKTIGQGELDLNNFILLLNKTKYSGFLTVEVGGKVENVFNSIQYILTRMR